MVVTASYVLLLLTPFRTEVHGHLRWLVTGVVLDHTDFKISKGYTVNFSHQRLVTAPLNKCL